MDLAARRCTNQAGSSGRQLHQAQLPVPVSRRAYRAVCSAAAPSPAAARPAAPPRVRHPKCLKEWSVAVEALGDGSQTVLFRKGGIKEPLFKPEASVFLLFPTAFHTDQQLLKPDIAAKYVQAMQLDPKTVPVLELPYVAEVTGAWSTHDASVFQALDPLHVWGPGFIETRLKWRKTQPLTVMELRVWRLAQPLQLPVKEDYFGCFSWVDLASDLAPGAVSMAGATPAISDKAFAAMQEQLRAALASIEAAPIQLGPAAAV